MFWRIENHVNFSELNPETIKISNELIKSVKEAHRCYRDQLEKQWKQQESLKSLNHKIVADEINALKEKRGVKLVSEIEMFHVDADLLAVKAEKHHDFRYPTQSN